MNFWSFRSYFFQSLPLTLLYSNCLSIDTESYCCCELEQFSVLISNCSMINTFSFQLVACQCCVMWFLTILASVARFRPRNCDLRLRLGTKPAWIVMLYFKWDVNSDPLVKVECIALHSTPTSSPLGNFLALENALRYIICSSRLKLTWPAWHCRHVKPVCVSPTLKAVLVRLDKTQPAVTNIDVWRAGAGNTVCKITDFSLKRHFNDAVCQLCKVGGLTKDNV